MLFLSLCWTDRLNYLKLYYTQHKISNFLTALKKDLTGEFRHKKMQTNHFIPVQYLIRHLKKPGPKTWQGIARIDSAILMLFFFYNMWTHCNCLMSFSNTAFIKSWLHFRMRIFTFYQANAMFKVCPRVISSSSCINSFMGSTENLN